MCGGRWRLFLEAMAHVCVFNWRIPTRAGQLTFSRKHRGKVFSVILKRTYFQAPSQLTVKTRHPCRIVSSTGVTSCSVMRKIAATRPLGAVIQIISSFCCHMGQISYQILFWMWRRNYLRWTCKRHSKATGRKQNEVLEASLGKYWAHASRHVINTLDWCISACKHTPATCSEHHYRFSQVLLCILHACCNGRFLQVWQEAPWTVGESVLRASTWPLTEGINKWGAAWVAIASSCTSATALW